MASHSYLFYIKVSGTETKWDHFLLHYSVKKNIIEFSTESGLRLLLFKVVAADFFWTYVIPVVTDHAGKLQTGYFDCIGHFAINILLQ